MTSHKQLWWLLVDYVQVLPIAYEYAYYFVFSFLLGGVISNP